MAKVPEEIHAMVLSAMECFALDCVEIADKFKLLTGAILKVDAAVQCAALDEIENVRPITLGGSEEG